MAYYLNIETNEYPRHDGDLQLLGWTKGTPLPENWVEVENTEQPVISDLEFCVEEFPTQVDGIWKRTWAVRNLTSDELEQRNTPYPREGTMFQWDSIKKEWKAISS
jgi:hypothetical protein